MEPIYDQQDADNYYLATENRELRLRLTAVTESIAVLRSTLVPFNERKQEFYCYVCRYRDPLGPDGNKLHDDNCPLLAVLTALEESQSADAVARSVDDPHEPSTRERD